MNMSKTTNVFTLHIIFHSLGYIELPVPFYSEDSGASDQMALNLAASLHLGTLVSSGSGPRNSEENEPWSEAGRLWGRRSVARGPADSLNSAVVREERNVSI